MPLPARVEAQPAAAAASTWSFSGILEALLPGNDSHVSVVSSYAATLAEGAGLTSALSTLVSLADDAALVTSPAVRAPNSGEVRRRRITGGEGAVPATSSFWDEWDPVPTPVVVRPQAAATAPLEAAYQPVDQRSPALAASRRPLAQPLRLIQQPRPSLSPAASPAPSASPGDSELMAQQMQQQLQLLLAEKARLAQENARLQRENQSLHELLAYSHNASGDECDSEHDDHCDAAPEQGQAVE